MTDCHTLSGCGLAGLPFEYGPLRLEKGLLRDPQARQSWATRVPLQTLAGFLPHFGFERIRSSDGGVVRLRIKPAVLEA